MKKVSLILSAVVMTGMMLSSFGGGASNQEGASNEVTIGSQVWMTKNLDVSTFRNGDPIPEAKTDEEWKKAGENGEPAWCYYNNNPDNGERYGKLYNWYAVNDSRGLAPEGWKIPSNKDWRRLTDFLGGQKVAGTKMRSKSGSSSYMTGGTKTCPNCVNWNAEYRRKVPCHTCQDKRSVPAPKVSNSGNGTNESGFSGLPGGNRYVKGSFNSIGEHGIWWSSTEKGTDYALYCDLWYRVGRVYRYGYNKQYGLSVRCLRD